MMASVVGGDKAATRQQRVKASYPVPENLQNTLFEFDEARHRVTPTLEKEHVVKVYEVIADQWDATRVDSLWPRVHAFLETQGSQSLIVDVGCGNGKNMAYRREGCSFGCDVSLNLCRIARSQGCAPEIVAADNMTLPFRSEFFDAAISIAVIHHFSNQARREQAVRETFRVLRQGGKALIYAWAFEQELFADSRHRFATQDVMIPWYGQKASFDERGQCCRLSIIFFLAV